MILTSYQCTHKPIIISYQCTHKPIIISLISERFLIRSWRRKLASNRNNKIRAICAISKLSKNRNPIRHRKRVHPILPLCNNRNHFHQRRRPTRSTYRRSSTTQNLGSRRRRLCWKRLHLSRAPPLPQRRRKRKLHQLKHPQTILLSAGLLLSMAKRPIGVKELSVNKPAVFEKRRHGFRRSGGL